MFGFEMIKCSCRNQDISLLEQHSAGDTWHNGMETDHYMQANNYVYYNTHMYIFFLNVMQHGFMLKFKIWPGVNLKRHSYKITR